MLSYFNEQNRGLFIYIISLLLTLNQTGDIQSKSSQLSIISSKCCYTYVTNDSFLKLSNLKSRFDISTKYDIYVPVGRAKYAVHCWATERKVTTEKPVYFYNNCNINVYIDCHHLLKSEKDIIASKKDLYKKFMNEVEPKLKKKSVMQLLVPAVV